VHLGSGQIQQFKDTPPKLITYTSTVRPVLVYKETGTDWIYSGSDVVQNQYQDQF